ncbi:Alkaline ceramidase [Cyphomyrmex costatus]|uniref:ceramidase n=1 Tax=Cyphomyrmex costatus TaxID=456900 RepID=A0A151IC19_9HYME|nr:Alkaline ceramidase [Cyphomyrmex costatus]
MTALSKSLLDLSRQYRRHPVSILRRKFSKDPPTNDWKVQRVVEKSVKELTRKEKDKNVQKDKETNIRVCIIGGGVTPLYIAILLKQYKIIKSIRLVDTRDSMSEALTDMSHLETSPRVIKHCSILEKIVFILIKKKCLGSIATYGGRIEKTTAAILNLERTAGLSVPLAGADPQTVVLPLLSRAVPYNQFTKAQRKTILQSFRAGDEETRTLSNVVFVLLPPVLMHLFRDYARFVNPGIHVFWFLLMVVGLTSAYFHATLSLIGQLLDELSILWVYMAGFCMFFPRRYFPNAVHNDRKLFSICATLPTLIATGLALIHPAVNAFALMSLGVPAIGFLIMELKRTTSIRVYRLGLRCGAMWVLAVICWLNDRLFCDTWLNLNFPYLHALWHLFIFIASYTAAVLFAYFAVQDEKPQQSPVLKYWPRDTFELGIPYVTIRSYMKSSYNLNI